MTLTRERVTKPSNDQETEPTPVNNVNRVKYVEFRRRKPETTTEDSVNSVHSTSTTEQPDEKTNLVRRIDIRKRTRPPVLTTTTTTSTTTEEPRKYKFISRSKPKNETFTIIVPETTISFSETTPASVQFTTTERVVPKTSTVTSVVTSITESSFTERQKITITKKPTFLKKAQRPTSTTERPKILRFRPRSTTTTTTTTSTTTTESPKRGRSRGFAARKVVRLRKPKPDLDTQESSSYYDDDDNEDLNSKFVLGETIKKKSKNDYLSAEVLFATVPTVEREESAITTPRVSRGRVKAQESITENVPEDYRKKIQKVFKRRKTEQQPVPEVGGRLGSMNLIYF